MLANIGANVQNVSVAGSGMFYTGITNQKYSVQVDNITGTPDLISVPLSLNDILANLPIGEISDTEETTFYGVLNTFFAYILAKFPATSIIGLIFFPSQSIHDNPALSDLYSKMVDAFQNVCAREQIPVTSLYNSSGLRPWIAANRAALFTDGSHPNRKGQSYLFRKVLPAYLAGLPSEDNWEF